MLMVVAAIPLIACGSAPPSETSTRESTPMSVPTHVVAVPATPPPMAKQVPKTLTAHGHERQDPWFWLRDDERDAPDVLAYLESENAYTAKALEPMQALKGRLVEEMKGRINKDDSSVPVLKDSYWYYTRFAGDAEHPIYCRRKGTMEAPEEVILDVNELAKGHDYYKVGAVSIAHGEQLLAFAEDTLSRRIYTIRFKDLKTGKILDDTLEGATGSIAWASDDKTLFWVVREPKTMRSRWVKRHTLGTKGTDDPIIHDEVDDSYYVSVSRTKSKKYVTIGLWSTLTSEVLAVDAFAPTGEFKPIVPRKDGHEYDVSHHGDYFYIRSNEGATNFRVVRAPIGNTADRGAWQEVLAHREDVLLDSIEVFDKHLVVSERKDALRQLRVIRWSDKAEHYLTFDEPIYVARFGANPSFNTQSLRLSYSSPVTPDTVFSYDMETRAFAKLKQDKVLGGFTASDYVAERRWAPTRDGKRVALSIVRRRDTPVDGTAPLYQYGYGSYGHTIDPYFSATRLSLLDRGFIIATAHIRGSEALGRPWYDDGKMMAKKNTFTDFVDATRFLVKEGYGHPKRVAAAGGSAGGLLMGAVVNMAPELYTAIHASVPFVDVVSTMLDATIPLTTNEYDEWGNPEASADAYHYMLSYSPYDNVVATDYPHMYVDTGLHDSQVQYWEPAKWVAKLRSVKTDSNLLLLDVDMSTGHSGKAGRFERFDKTAQAYAFLIYVLGADNGK